MIGIYYGKFVFKDKELIFDEFELIQLLKLCEKRNRHLHKKFVLFYKSVLEEEDKSIINEEVRK